MVCGLAGVCFESWLKSYQDKRIACSHCRQKKVCFNFDMDSYQNELAYRKHMDSHEK